MKMNNFYNLENLTGEAKLKLLLSKDCPNDILSLFEIGDLKIKAKLQFSFEITFREDEIASACDVYTKLEEDEDVICNDLGPSQDFVWEEMEGEGESISYEFIIKNPERKESIISEIQDDYGMEIDKIQEY